jgi:hypothetical protein
MPRGRRPSGYGAGPTAEDLAQFEAALAGMLQTAVLQELPGDILARLVHLCASRGYSLTISPSLGGRAYRLRVPFAEKALEVYLSDTDNVRQLLDSLLLAVGRLPTRSTT